MTLVKDGKKSFMQEALPQRALEGGRKMGSAPNMGHAGPET